GCGGGAVGGVVGVAGLVGGGVGLSRSEAASDVRPLAAAGARGRAGRTIPATTAGALGFTGAVLGTVGGYVAAAGWFRTNSFNGGLSALVTTIPVTNLLIILVGMPLIAVVIGWLLAGREPPGLAHQPRG